jgi:hypothetical protein
MTQDRPRPDPYHENPRPSNKGARGKREEKAPLKWTTLFQFLPQLSAKRGKHSKRRANMTRIDTIVELSPSVALPQIAGLKAGTTVMTLAGECPVEALTAGDRIITRAGARTLRAIREEAAPAARMICISASALGVEKPAEDMIVAPDQKLLIRDWRAKALKGADNAVVEARNLVDGEYIRSVSVPGGHFYTLEFDAPVVIYVGGVELASTAG